MRRIRISELNSGMIVARTITDSEGRILLRSGVQLNEHYIDKLSPWVCSPFIVGMPWTVLRCAM
jgi:hypothetical protein